MESLSTQYLIVFILVCICLILMLISFIVFVIYQYKQKQNLYCKDMEQLKAIHRDELLQSQIEIQEQTFENISREIHDNIGQKLTLAKLHLNTLDLLEVNNASERLQTSVSLISDAIIDLSDISRSLSAEVIANNGLIKALELEVQQMRKSSLYNISFEINGEPVFLDSHRELIVFRIIQESLSNIMKHAAATLIKIKLNYTELLLQVNISDNGKGFSVNQPSASGTGIANMKRRAGWLKGECLLDSIPGAGTNINIEIPLI